MHTIQFDPTVDVEHVSQIRWKKYAQEIFIETHKNEATFWLKVQS